MKRNTFIFLVCFILSSVPIGAQQVLLPHDGVINIYAYHVDEFLAVKYLDDKGAWIPQAYEELNHLLRSRGDNLETQMDKRLIELADHLQDHFKVDTIEVISGYRSPDFNKQLKEEGHNVANESFHTKGMAMDIHIDEITEATIRDYLLKQKLGGVGYYGDRLMVHMDFGPVREWHSGDFRENIGIGIFNKESQISIKTDRLKYDLNSSVLLTFENITDKTALTLEKFHHGKWQKAFAQGISISGLKSMSLKVVDLQKQMTDLSVFGKFRLVYKTKTEWQNSNEFYVKK